jgi:hypothetical protein
MILDFRKRYIEALKKRSDGRSIVTDKMPQNFLYVGLIFSAFPDAKVIHVNRDPAATCWSNYKHYFIDKDLGYCYDLDDTVTYFGLYTDLMQFWLGHYGDRIYNINLSKRRIQSFVNYLRLYENMSFSPFLKSGFLEIIELSFGESKSTKKVSDNPNDRLNSIYSLDAILERRIEIIDVKLIDE